MTISSPVVISGLVVGFMYALIGLGLVIEYRASKIVNFAHGSQAMIGAFMFNAYRGAIGTVPAILVAVAASGVTGLIIHALAVDYLRRSTALSQVIVTVGVLLILQGFAQKFYVKAGQQYAGSILHGTIKVFGVYLSGDQLLVIVIGVSLIVGLTAFFKFTRVGLAMRAAADRRTVAEYLGLNTRELGRLAWTLGSALAGLAGVLLSPLLFLDPVIFSLLIIEAYSAILIGRMESIPLTLVGGLFVGLVQSLAEANAGGILGIREIVAVSIALGALILTAHKLDWASTEEAV